MPLARKKTPTPGPLIPRDAAKPKRSSLAKLQLIAAHIDATRGCLSSKKWKTEELRLYRNKPAEACSKYLGIHVTPQDIADALAISKRMQSVLANRHRKERELLRALTRDRSEPKSRREPCDD